MYSSGAEITFYLLNSDGHIYMYTEMQVSDILGLAKETDGQQFELDFIGKEEQDSRGKLILHIKSHKE